MSEQTPPARSNNLPAKIGIGVLVVVIFLAVVIYSRSGSDSNEVANSNSNTESVAQENVSTTTTTPVTNSGTNTNTEVATSGYKDGTYSSTGTYTTPGGREEVAVSVTLKDGKVANSTVTAEAKSPTSKQFQGEFINNYKQFVTGKSIDSLKLSKVSGSSLTAGGFNAAIEKIKAEAAI